MAKTMLIDATHPEETRVAVVDGRKLEEFDVEVASRRPLKGNIYLAKVTRVEPSLQAAFVEYGGNRHGFLAFSEIHPDYYRIPIADREALLREAAAALDDDADDEIDHRRGRRRRDRDDRGDGPRHGDQQNDHRHDSHRADDRHDDEHSHGDHGHDDHAHDDDDDQPDHDALGHDDDHHHDEDDRYHGADTDHPGSIAASGADADTATDMMVSESGEFVPSPAHNDAHLPTSDLHDTEHRGGDAMPLAARQDILRGEPQGFDGSDETAEPTTGADNDFSADADEIPASPQAEIVEVTVLEEVFDTAAPEESAIQDDPDADEERARRRRQRNMRRYKIQEVIKRRQILLVQVTKEERGNKGAALTTYLSLAGRYCVLMPNTDRGGGISRRITSATDRKRLKSIIDDLDAPEGMAVIVRTAGSERSRAEVKRDFEYLLRLWDEIRDVTLRSTAPALIYEEASLIKRSIRDLYTRDIGDIIVAGGEAYMAAKSFMRTLTPSHAKRVQLYRDNSIPLFQRYQIESQLAAIHQPVVQLKSGGYIVINQTEALVAVDVNSGRSTKERNIEETALRTNLEAADEVARQLRLRDLAGLIVIDFIDMEENRNNAAVERRMKEALKNDRARIQIGRISSFGLLEMSRQRLHPSLAEASTEICPHCAGTGRIRSVDSTALHVLRMVEEEITRSYSPGITVMVPGAVALYILNQKRASLSELEQRRGVRIYLESDNSLIPPDYRLERLKLLAPGEEVQQRQLPPVTVVEEEFEVEDEIEVEEDETAEAEGDDTDEAAAGGDNAGGSGDGRRGRGRRRRRRGGRNERFRVDEFTEAAETGAANADGTEPAPVISIAATTDDHVDADDDGEDDGGDDDDVEAGSEAADGDQPRRRRRRGRRGGRRRSRRPQDGEGETDDQTVAAGSADGHLSSDAEPSSATPSSSGTWAAGTGDQPNLPDVLPAHWQQATPRQMSFTEASDTIDISTEAAGSASLGAPANLAGEEAGAVDAEAARSEQGNTRRRSRRDEGERAPRSRRPRRSREDAAGAETDASETPEVTSIEASPAQASPGQAISQATIVETTPAPETTAAVIVATPQDAVISSPAATAAPQSPVSKPTHLPDAALEGRPASPSPVTVIGETAPEDDGPKRRGWWRRLME